MNVIGPRLSHSPSAVLALTLPEGNDGVLQTLEVMKACIDDAIAFGGPALELAREVAATAGRNRDAQIKAVYNFLVERFIFRADPLSLEHLTHPDILALKIRDNWQTAGDCDDVAILGATMIGAIGLKPALLVVSIKPGGQFHHVLFGAQVGGLLITLDPQERMFDQLPDTLTNKYVLTW